MSLFALEQVPHEVARRKLDVGTGSGVLSIASSLGCKKDYAYDLDEIVVRVAQENIELNANMENIQVATGDLSLWVWIVKANVIVANILADILVNLPDDAVPILLKNEGYLIMSGIISEKWEMVRGVSGSGRIFLRNTYDPGRMECFVYLRKHSDVSCG